MAAGWWRVALGRLAGVLGLSALSFRARASSGDVDVARIVVHVKRLARFATRFDCRLPSSQRQSGKRRNGTTTPSGCVAVGVRSRTAIAMQKVEGSSPFIRFTEPPQNGISPLQERDSNLKPQAEVKHDVPE
jgi:hypothetical protein